MPSNTSGPSRYDEDAGGYRTHLHLAGAIRGGGVCSDRPIVPFGNDGLKDAWFPQFSAAACRRRQKIGSPIRRLRRSRAAILDPAIPSRRWSSSFTNVKETTMTYSLEIEVAELRAELANAVDRVERRQIEAELELAQAELVAALAEQDGTYSAEPPF
ncbi:hypothetical protein FG152_17395 [Ochrobactrum sp. XJ1]|nr:hypothetical protein [Ochrobactrum sp. XJ1]